MAAAGNRTGILSSFADLFSDEEPDMKGKLVVFDPAVFRRTQTQLKDLDANRAEWKDVYGQFKTDWESGQPAAEGRAKQESSFLDKFYDGSFSNYLAGLRAKESDARRAAGDRALEYARGATDRASLMRGEPTGTSSATRAMGYRLARDIENDIALNDINRERGDFDYITKGQSSFLGARNNILDSVMKRQLLPHQLNDQELVFAINALKGIQGTRLGSASPVFWREKDDAEKIGDVLDTFADSAYKGANAYMTFSGMGGGMGGGGGQKPSTSSSSSGGGTFNYSMPTVPATGNYSVGSVNPYAGSQSSWYDAPEYSPGNSSQGQPGDWQYFGPGGF